MAAIGGAVTMIASGGPVAAVRDSRHTMKRVTLSLLVAALGGAPFGAGLGLMGAAARGGPPAGSSRRRLLPVDGLIAAAQAAGPAAFLALIALGPLDGWRHAARWVSSASLVQLGPTQARAAIGGTLWLALAIGVMVHRSATPRIAGPLPPADRWSLAGSGFAAGLFGLPLLASLALS